MLDDKKKERKRKHDPLSQKDCRTFELIATDAGCIGPAVPGQVGVLDLTEVDTHLISNQKSYTFASNL